MSTEVSVSSHSRMLIHPVPEPNQSAKCLNHIGIFGGGGGEKTHLPLSKPPTHVYLGPPTQNLGKKKDTVTDISG